MHFALSYSLQFPQGPGPAPAQQASQAPQGASNALATNQQLQQLATQTQAPYMPGQPLQSGHVNLPRNYGSSQQPQPTGPTAAYQVGYQYNNPGGEPKPGYSTSMAPVRRSRTKRLLGWLTGKQANHNGPWPPPDVPQYPVAQRAPTSVPFVVEREIPVILCHLCSVCGRTRSAGYHRKHPAVPGRPPLQEPCRKCKMRAQRKRVVREPEENNTITIRIEDGSGRGREPERREVRYVRRHSSPSPRRTRRSSRANIGVRVLQEDDRRKTRTSTEVRYSSASPPVAMRARRRRSEEIYSPAPPPPPAPRPRFVELSPSPPPTRRSTRVQYREDTVERHMRDYRPRSPSPVRISRREHRGDDAEARLASHPAPFRSVRPEHRTYLRESEASISTDSPTRGLSPRRGILRNAEMDYETSHRRQMRESYDSMLPEVGHNRVQFTGEPTRRDDMREPDMRRDQGRTRIRYEDSHIPSEGYLYRRRAECEYDDQPPPLPPSPPTQNFDRLHIRHSSPPSSRGYDRETRVRHISPDGRYVEARTRHVSPVRGRGARAREFSPDSPSRFEYRSIRRNRPAERAPSPEPEPRHADWSDVTDSGSDDPRVQTVHYKEFDDQNRLMALVEHRRTRMLPEAPPEEPPRPYAGPPALEQGHALNYRYA
jgi:hypothetical protein